MSFTRNLFCAQCRPSIPSLKLEVIPAEGSAQVPTQPCFADQLMNCSSTSVKYYLLGEAADVAALFLTQEKELRDPKLTSGPCTALLGSHRNVEHYRGFEDSLLCIGVKHLAQAVVGTHSTLPAATLSSRC
uniref:Uncharacterized protein n=1 Tax=Cyanistes caeruleus TaxID=156563 RepID=A0A8C0VGU1_CYACU